MILRWGTSFQHLLIKKAQKEAREVELTFGYAVDVSSLAKEYGLSNRDILVMEGSHVTATDLPIYYAVDNREAQHDYVLR